MFKNPYYLFPHLILKMETIEEIIAIAAMIYDFIEWFLKWFGASTGWQKNKKTRAAYAVLSFTGVYHLTSGL